MRLRHAILAAAAAATLAAALSTGTAGADPSTVLPASVVDITRPVSTASFPTTDFGRKPSAKDDKQGTTTWRVVQGTGNCCENYLAASKQGVIYDFGGSFVNFSADGGQTWKQVQPLTPLVNGEGSIVIAPNGDVIAVGWDPYSGDHLQAFKYEAFSGKWFSNELPLHSPFYDREWVAVVPGPFSVDGQTVPYLSFFKGGYPSKEVWYRSTDGLNYTDVTSKLVGAALNGDKTGPLATAKLAALDWIQPNTGMGLSPTGAGTALAAPDEGSWAFLDRDGTSWFGYSFPSGEPEGLHQIDSKGRIHEVVPGDAGFDYRVSTDGGTSWRALTVPLPADTTIDQIDLRVNGALDLGAVAVHGQNSATGFDQDLAYKIELKRDAPVLKRLYHVGLGDTASTSGVGNSIRMDFQTVVILPDRRIALSFLDSTTHYPSPTTGQEQPRPALAIELSTTF
jgi:hypothetical protein